MAIKPTILKAQLDISDMDRHYYDSHTLSVARHPSETDERVMVRLLAFALNALVVRRSWARPLRIDEVAWNVHDHALCPNDCRPSDAIALLSCWGAVKCDGLTDTHSVERAQHRVPR